MDLNASFVHLHVHTEFSLLDGAIRIPRMLEKAWSLGMDSVAITDHGNMFGAVQFFDQAKKSGIKPILGCEVYLAPGDRRDRSAPTNGGPTSYHLILLVMNAEGYKNLSRLVTLGHLEGFYYHPRIDMSLLKQLNAGLIALSACLKGPVAFPIREGRVEEARKRAMELASIFDGDRFFLEVQANGMEDQEKVNAVLKEFAQELSLPLVATNDCHYLDRSDAEAHDALLCIQTGKSVDDDNRLRFPTDEFYFKSRAEMKEALPGFEEALDNTVHVAKRCNFEMEFGNYKYPVFHVPGGKSLDQMLREQAEEGLTVRLQEKVEEEGPVSPETEQDYRERLNYELDIICKMGFSGYFLIVSDFIEYARRSKIPVGPGRGSAAGSLVAYCLRITNIDPLRYGLLFERFLNPQRISMPDIDIDFCMNGRDDVIRYVAEKYGRDNVCQIITFGTMKARAVIRDVGRTLNIPLAEVDKIAKMVPEGPNVSLEKALATEPELQALEKEKAYVGKLLRISRALEGLARHASTHASGVVISDRPLVEYLPLYKGPRDEIMTQFTMDRIEQLGLIKFDFLGLRTLTVIKHTLDLIEKTLGHKLDMDKIPLDDEATYQLCCDGKTTGVFQLESDGMKKLMRRLKPGVFEDMVALVALYRPGPLGSNMIDEFIQGKHGKVEINYILPQLEPILKETYGVILYQEQVMRIAQVLADYSLAEADELRKAIGKKKPEVMARHHERFIQGAVKNGVDLETAEKLFALIEKFGGYGFNKSHSVAYAMIAYQTAYLKAHYPVQFMAALLTQDMGNQDKTIKNIAECREMGIEILPPDINESEADFSVVEGKIRFGLGAIKNVGLKAVESIIEERRAHGPFRSIHDFCRRVEGAKVNRRVLEGLIQCGAFDFTGIPRARLFAGLDDISRFCGVGQDPNQLNMFGALELGEGGPFPLFELPDVEEWEFKEKLKREKESLGFYITGHPLDRFKEDLKRLVTCSIQDLSHQQDHALVHVAGMAEGMKVKRTKKGDKMAVISLEDLSGSIEVIIFPDLFAASSALLKGDDPLLVAGNLEKTENSTKIIAKEVVPLDAAREKYIKILELTLSEEAVTEELLDDLRELAFTFPGECRLRFRVHTKKGKTLLVDAHSRFRVIPTAELVSRLERLTGSPVRARMG
ncbi:MAG: DNA polymerase III subunit alpha [Deltaproteobacteria bacterium]|nr:DNA polymerase III subunit alpha [Deltaproteobacteria bacterium]MBW1930834.1 DNA polymerase III subunit alpha [Deltaproteobacteria bacterium]MBW2025644.1 DNA polymerase III subunit alpha [Deltaproteobacteria bacterium]MBW2125719.1 DNA polymerase III subunit alpha [Deltaproteobacteria bacterium]